MGHGFLLLVQENEGIIIILPPWYRGGGGGLMEPLPRGFDMLKYFEVILPSVENL